MEQQPLSGLAEVQATASDREFPMRLRQTIPVVVVIVVVLVAGALFWSNNHAQHASTPSMAASEPRTTGSAAPQGATQQGTPQQGTTQQAATPQATGDLAQTVKDLQAARNSDESRINDLQQQLSAEQGERKLLSDQVAGLAGRLDGLEKARAEYRGPARKQRR
jgi:hypothetical protein